MTQLGLRTTESFTLHAHARTAEVGGSDLVARGVLVYFITLKDFLTVLVTTMVSVCSCGNYTWYHVWVFVLTFYR